MGKAGESSRESTPPADIYLIWARISIKPRLSTSLTWITYLSLNTLALRVTSLYEFWRDTSNQSITEELKTGTQALAGHSAQCHSQQEKRRNKTDRIDKDSTVSHISSTRVEIGSWSRLLIPHTPRFCKNSTNWGLKTCRKLPHLYRASIDS